MKHDLFRICILLTFCIQQASAKIFFQHIGPADGLSQVSVMSITQDELGRIWIGTQEGLNCYDGRRVTAYKPTVGNPLSGNRISQLASDRQGSLFIITDGRLMRYDINQERFELADQRTVTALHEREGEVWMATADSVFHWEGGEFRYVIRRPTQAAITTLLADHRQRLWMGTYDGLYLCGESQKAACILPHGQIRALYEDSHGNVWTALFRNGGYCIKPNGETVRIGDGTDGIGLATSDIRSFVEDNGGDLWIATFEGLLRRRPGGQISRYGEDILPGSLKHSSIFPLYKDRQGNIWLGAYFGGLHYFHPQAELFTHYARSIDRDDCLANSIIEKMAEDKRGEIWIITGGQGLDRLNRRTGRITHYRADGRAGSIPTGSLMSIAYNEQADRIYVGTYNKGLCSIDAQTGRVKHYTPYEQYGTSVVEMATHGHRLYMRTTQGLYVLDMQTDLIQSVFTRHSRRRLGEAFTADQRGCLWIASGDSLFCYNPEQQRYLLGTSYVEAGIERGQVAHICEGRDGRIWLATKGAGLHVYDPGQKQFAHYTAAGGWLQSDYCYNLAPYGDYLVVTGDKGVTLFHPDAAKVKRIDLNRMALNALDEECGLLVCRDRTVMVSGVDGAVSIDMGRLAEPSMRHDLYFSTLTVDGQPTTPQDSRGILQVTLPRTKRVELDHDQNHISVGFAAVNYIPDMRQPLYEYRLLGLDSRWTRTDRMELTYTNLSPGEYKLQVREAPEGTQHNPDKIELAIRVRHPWWDTWWAWTAYLALAATVIYILVTNRLARLRLHASLERERIEKEKQVELTQAKLQFFANISHELRTPLTIIISQVESLLQADASIYIHTRLTRIYRTTFQLRELIGELLDFRKMERGGIVLKVSRMDIIPLLNHLTDSFSEQADRHNIQLTLHTDLTEAMLWMDPKQMGKVFSNLLSNALKYTPDGGHVNVSVGQADGQVEVKVTDDGQGIRQEDLDHIFERFYQADQGGNRQSPGTGIGLALTKGLVELHHGTISVHSAWGYGSIFSVLLPTAYSFDEDDPHVRQIEPEEQRQRMQAAVIQPIRPVTPDNEPAEEAATATNTPTEEGQEHDRHILIVEDNEELLQQLSELLSPIYKVSVALDGQMGLERALEERPDLVLSDVMMPVMDGMKMCAKIKGNLDICHTPVILLTALTDEGKELAGLQCGADDYIRKPYSNKVLTGRIAAILRNRQLQRRQFARQAGENLAGTREEATAGMAPLDKEFTNRLDQIIGQNLTNPTFSLDVLAQQAGISRSTLYNKLKALSNMTPGEYVQQARLNHAAHMLLTHPDMQVTEIAYDAGFSSLRYFRHCFKASFGISPQEYRKNGEAPTP